MRQRAKCADEQRNSHRCRRAFATYVANEGEDAAGGSGHNLEEVAAHFAGRFVCAFDDETRNGRYRFRDNHLLDGSRGLHLTGKQGMLLGGSALIAKQQRDHGDDDAQQKKCAYQQHRDVPLLRERGLLAGRR